MLEARARGVAPLIAWRRMQELPSEPAVIAIDDRAIALQLGVPIALTWGE